MYDLHTRPEQSADQEKAKKYVLVEKLKALISPKFLDMSEKSCTIEGLISNNLLTSNSDYK